MFAAEVVGQHKHSFSVIAITETNVNACHKDLYRLSNYTSEYNEKFEDKRKGTGIGIYVHNDYIFNRNKKFCRCTKNLECLFITITNLEVPVTVGVFYRPPSGSVKDFLSEWEGLLEGLPKTNVLLMGDFNIDLFKPNSDFENVFYSNNLIPTISVATHEKPGCRPSLIDNIFINNSEGLRSAGVLDNRVSHHSPIFCFLDYKKSSTVEDEIKCPKYDYCNSNIDTFLEKICTEVMEKSYDCDESGFSGFVGDIKGLVESCFRVDEEQFKKSRRNFYTNPWITPGLIASVNKKHFYYKIWRKSKSRHDPNGDSLAYDKYKSYRRYLKKTIKLAKKNHYSKKFENVNGDLKKTWGLINELRGKVKQNIKASFIIDRKLVEDRREIANGFNKFFASVAKNLNAKICSSTLNHSDTDFKSYLGNRVDNSIFMSSASACEIEKIVQEFGNDKASDIPILVLKKCSTLVSGHLAVFLNKFMEAGSYPSILKVGKITPVYKKDDPQKLGNYRPVSVIPIFSKIFEKLLYSRIYSFLTAMNVIYDKQFGFRKNHSTSHAVNYSVNKLLTEIEEKRHTIGIFIDLSKAFDTIDHCKLLIKLEHYGIRGSCHALLTSYLANRTQYTNFQQVESEYCSVKFGVPQGSVLGPLLFLIYINDIINSTNLGHFVLFADDTNIFVSGKDENDAYRNAQIVLDKVRKYMNDNLLHINLDKSVYMYFRPSLSVPERLTCARTRQFGSENSLRIGEHKLKKVDKVKFLGVIIDDNLRWEHQIENIINKLILSIVMIKRVTKFVPKSEYMKIYDALFKSHMSYCISSWGSVPNYRLKKIFSLQKRCVRLLFGKEYSFDHSGYYETCARARTYEENMSPKNFCLEHTKPIFNERKILTVYNVYVHQTFVELYKILKSHSPVSIFNLFSFSVRDTNFHVYLPKIRLDISKNNYVFKSSALWNSLIGNIFEKDMPGDGGVIVRGSAKNSDFCATISFIKHKLRDMLFCCQKAGDPTIWEPPNIAC
jgi:hypothetical protein